MKDPEDYTADLAEDFDEAMEPEEEDWVTSDYRTWTVMGTTKLVIRTDPDTWERELNAEMKRQGFFPNVWWCSDHGNWLLLTVRDED